MVGSFFRYDNQDRIRVHLTDSTLPRWEMPQSLLPRAANEQLKLLRNATSSTISSKGKAQTLNSNHPLEFFYTTNPFGFTIRRRSNGEVLFNSTPSTTTNGNGNQIPLFHDMVFKDQYLEISTQLPCKSALYGLGESTQPSGLRLEHGRTYTLWATDIGSYNEFIDLYGSYPFYMDVRAGGFAHGVQLINSMEWMSHTAKVS